MIAEQRARLPRDDSKKKTTTTTTTSSSSSSESTSIYATSSLCVNNTQGQGCFDTSQGAYFPSSGTNIRDFSHLTSSYGSESVFLSEEVSPEEEGSKKKKVFFPFRKNNTSCPQSISAQTDT